MRRALLILALSLLSACGRCDSDEAPSSARPEPQAAPSGVRVSAEADTDPARLVVHRADRLAELRLDDVEHLDLALSPEDLIGHLDDADAESSCVGLDLTALVGRTPKLRSLRVSGCTDALRAGLHALAPRIEQLELADVEMDRALLGRIAELSKLRELQLVRVTSQTEFYSPLAKIPLQRLVLAELEKDSDLSQMADQWPRTLTEVSLIGRWAGHKAMLTLARALALRRLELNGTRITNFSFHQIKTLPHLEELALSGETFSDSTPLYFRELPLTRLTCDCPRLSDGGLRTLRKSHTLTRIDLPRSRVTAEGLAHLAELPKLTHLTLAEMTANDAALASLASLGRLEHLQLSGTLEAPAMPGLGDLGALVVLRLDFKGLDDQVGAELTKLESLEELYVAGSNLSDDGLRSMASLKQLRVLDLSRTRVTNRGLEHLANLSQLEVLMLGNTDVVDDGIAHLRGLSRLRELRLEHTLVTDAGLQHLMELTQLERLGPRPHRRNGRRRSRTTCLAESANGWPRRHPRGRGLAGRRGSRWGDNAVSPNADQGANLHARFSGRSTAAKP